MGRTSLDRIHWVLIGLVGVLTALVITLMVSNGGEASRGSEPPDTTGTTTTTVASAPLPASPGATLAAVQDRGVLNCGVRASDLPGFLNIVDGQPIGGFDYEFCRALAAVVLGDANSVRFVPLNTEQRWSALADPDQIDVLIRNTTWTSGRDVRFDFGPTTFYDGQQLMGSRGVFEASSGVDDLDGSAVCVARPSTSYDKINELRGELGLDTRLVETGSVDDAVVAFESGQCDAVTADGSALLTELSARAAGGRWVIFPDRPFSKEPLGPVVRRDDSQWADIVSWMVYALLIADEKDIGSHNIEVKKTAAVDVETQLLLGRISGFADQLGLDREAFARAIEQVGSYSEIFTRTLSPLGMPRGQNTDPEAFGLLYAPPIRAGE